MLQNTIPNNHCQTPLSIRKKRAGFTQVKFNEDALSLVIFEILLIAVAFGIGMQSWWRDGEELRRSWLRAGLPQVVDKRAVLRID